MLDENQLDQAENFGATNGVVSGSDGWPDTIMGMTDGLGVGVAIEAVGPPAMFETCMKIVRPGGTVANAGVHGKPVEPALNDLWIKDVAITMGLVRTSTTPMQFVAQQKVAARG